MGRNIHDFPQDAITASSGDVAAAQAQASLAAASGRRTHIMGFTVTGGGATSAGIVQVSVAGCVGGTMTFDLPVPAGATAALTPLNVSFPFPIPASADNTAITVTVPSLGAGNAHAAVCAYGFQV